MGALKIAFVGACAYTFAASFSGDTAREPWPPFVRGPASEHSVSQRAPDVPPFVYTWELVAPPSYMKAFPPLQNIISDCREGGDICTITRNPGGSVREFQWAAHQVNLGARRLVRIDGTCISACVIFADEARGKVCITPRARMALHKGREYEREGTAGMEKVVFKRYFDPPHSPDILKWVHRKGGFPENNFLIMPYAVAKTIWQTCEPDPPLPRPRPRLSF